MSAQELVRKTYRAYIETMPIPTELKRSLRTHERVPRFIDNMAAEFQKLTFDVKRETIISAVEDMTRIFVLALQTSAEQKALSPIAKAMIKKREADMNQFRREAAAIEKAGVNNVTLNKDGEISTQVVNVDDLVT